MNQEVVSKIKKICDVLWAGGLTDPVSYIEQISYLIFLKMYDEKISQKSLEEKLTGKKSTLIYNKEFRWGEWCYMSGDELRDFLRDEVFPYMQSLVKENVQAAEYFRSAQLIIVDPNTLKEVISILDTINFSQLGPDVSGDVYEYLLTHLGQSALNGQYRTPKQIRAFMVEMVDPDIGDTIIDPAVGTGGFLLDSYNFIRYKHSENPIEHPIYGEEWEKGDHSKSSTLQYIKSGIGDKISDKDYEKLNNYTFTGYDVSRAMVRIGTMNMILHGLENGGIRNVNSLSEFGGLSNEDLNKKYSVILSNPPFAGVLDRDSIRKDISTTGKKTEMLFLAAMMDMLAPGGRAAIVVPEGLLFGSTNAHVELRRKLVEDFELQAVVSLPPGVFKPYAGVKTTVLVFKKPEGDLLDDSRKVWFYDVLNDGYDPNKITNEVRPETPLKNEIPDLLNQWNNYKKTNFKEPPGIEGSTTIDAGNEMPKCWWATIEKIRNNDYNITADRYKPTVLEKVSKVDPKVLLKEILEIENSIVNDLKKLQKDIG